MKVIADSSPLISFAILNRLELLMQLYTEIRIPQAVFDEIAQPGKPMPRCFTCLVTIK